MRPRKNSKRPLTRLAPNGARHPLPRGEGTERIRECGHFRSCKIARRRCGVTGSCVIAPGMPIASSMAEAIAAPTALAPPSPAPFSPSGLSGLGASSVISTSSAGTSRAVGIR